jgi:hypothetical protein
MTIHKELDWPMVIAVSEKCGACIFRLKHSKRRVPELSDPEGGGTAHLQNVGNYSPVDATSHYPRLATHHLLTFNVTYYNKSDPFRRIHKQLNATSTESTFLFTCVL